jgi:hypothetical protein
MARQAKTVELVANTGLEAVYAAAHAEGHAAPWTKDMVFHVKQGVGARVATIPVGETFEGRAITALTVNIDANTEVFIGPFSARYVQADGTIWLNWDATSNTTFAALRLGVG